MLPNKKLSKTFFNQAAGHDSVLDFCTKMTYPFLKKAPACGTLSLAALHVAG